MSWYRLDRILWLVAAIGAALTVVGWRTAAVVAAPRPAIGDAPAPPAIDADTMARAAARVGDTDPFRLDRRPAAVVYRATVDGVQPVSPPRPPRPALVLKGIVGTGRATAWVALLDGIPAHSGTMVVHAGDTLGGLRVRQVGKDTVVVTATDTTWRLTLRRAWQ
jgi:hypothetical protein